MRKNKILFVFLIVALAFTSCAKTVEPAQLERPIEIVIWNTWSDFHVEEFQKRLDDFNSKHPDIKVIQQPQPLANYEAKVMQAVREGQGPDIINAFPTLVANFISDGLVVNLSQYIDDPEIGIPGFKESLHAAAYETITQWDGNVYLLPLALYGEVLYYNKTLFENLELETPKTWLELEESARKIFEATGKPAFGFDSEIDGFQVLISQNGSGYLNPETMTVEYNNPIAVEQLAWFCGLVEEGVFRLVGEDVYFSNPFGSQAVASYIGSPAGYGFVDLAVNGQFDFDVAPIPQTGVVDYVSDWGNGYIIFTSDEAHQRAAFEFLKYMQTPEVLASWSSAYGVVPAYQEAIQQPAFQEYLALNAAMKAASEQLHRTGYLPAVPGTAALRSVIGKAVAAVCGNMMSAQEALNMAEQEGNAELSQYK